MKIDYTFLDPTGNMTILVRTSVPEEEQVKIGGLLMGKEPEAEQVGFLSDAEGYDISLRMAGGEFCGNASMCAAVLSALRDKKEYAEVTLKVSGTPGPVAAEVEKQPDGSWRGTVTMPRPRGITMTDLPEIGRCPVAAFDGISHVITEGSLPRAQAEKLAPVLCGMLGADAAGLMFLDRQAMRLTPLVYVRTADTLFWEHSCASGTTAVGAYLAKESGGPVSVKLSQPGGILAVEAAENGGLYLTGSVRIVKEEQINI